MEIFLTIEIILEALNLSKQEYECLLEKHGRKGIFSKSRLDKVIDKLRRNSMQWFDTDESEIDWKNITRQIKRMLSASPPQKVSIGKSNPQKRSRSGTLKSYKTQISLLFKRPAHLACHWGRIPIYLTRNSTIQRTNDANASKQKERSLSWKES